MSSASAPAGEAAPVAAPAGEAAPAAARTRVRPMNGSLAWIAAFMLAVSMLNTLFRPDPTAAVCMLGIYAGAREDSGTRPIAAFAAATALSLITDALWWATDDTILAHSLGTPDEFNHLPRAVQLPVCLTALNAVYKVFVIPFAVVLIALQCCGRGRAANKQHAPAASPPAAAAAGPAGGT